ncbi:SgrR family transcriptional regulator [Vibrio sp. JPW-9-11-11]|uniref:SgrR family transcriptional regulator n=1 Tax=Vibrio sp. JPW-9-11-11 TaxID=1416532 RepID=UPI001594DF4D|nr:SgrR family transcriptional regulator [Vibrio sp. JPW-9-11-11]NVD08807.1 SgrR family transcriptional regulator [Vibrio sp. JPW-9-11-11]
MSDINLLRYYTRMIDVNLGSDIKTTLPEVANILCTSPRHARNLLNQMQQLGWLNWQPKPGRNQRSTLRLHQPIDELKRQLASERIRQGQYEKALSLLDHDQVAFGRLLQSTSGATLREGLLHIQLTYKRAFERLVPHQLQRSSERYLLRQVYCCLVSSRSDGELEPQLAHHWHYDESSLEWSFFLRPSLMFHDNSPITAQCIVELFNQLTQLDDYQSELNHLARVYSPSPNKVVFQLNSPDQGFGGLISGVKYSIQPPNQVNQATSMMVIGSGPFEVTEHSETKLCLKAFDRYYACRALTDQVTIWHLDESELCDKQIETNQPGASLSQQPNYYVSHAVSETIDPEVKQSRTEDGCLFILFNQCAKTVLNDTQRRFLSTFITPESVYRYLEQSDQLFGCELASNLLPIWHKITRPEMPHSALPNKLDIAIYDYSSLHGCALAVKHLLEHLGVDVTINSYSYRQLTHLSVTGQLAESLIITNINLDDNRHASAFNSLYHNPIIQRCIGEHSRVWLLERLNQLRAETKLCDYLDALEPIASALINQFWLSPLFHHRQTLRFQGVLKDVALTNWGWPDIKNVWSSD